MQKDLLVAFLHDTNHSAMAVALQNALDNETSLLSAAHAAMEIESAEAIEVESERDRLRIENDKLKAKLKEARDFHREAEDAIVQQTREMMAAEEKLRIAEDENWKLKLDLLEYQIDSGINTQDLKRSVDLITQLIKIWLTNGTLAVRDANLPGWIGSKGPHGEDAA